MFHDPNGDPAAGRGYAPGPGYRGPGSGSPLSGPGSEGFAGDTSPWITPAATPPLVAPMFTFPPAATE